MADTEKIQEKLVRCVCGEVYDVLKLAKCPECGKAVGEKSRSGASKPRSRKKTETVATTDTGEVKPPVPALTGRQILTYALGFLVVVFLVTKVVGFFGKKPAQAGTLPAAAVIVPEKTIPHPQPLPKTNKKEEPSFQVEPYTPPQAVRSGGVDQALVGTWHNITQGGYGTQSWYLYISPEGRYSFAVGGGGVNSQHAGTFTALNGRWEMVAQTISHTDAGTYRVVSANQMEMEGQQGAWVWYREGAGSNNAVPSGPQPPKSLQNEWQQQQEQQQYQQAYDTLKQKAAQMAQDFLRNRTQRVRV